MSDYKPADCELYSRFELAIMHRQRLQISWRTPENVPHIEVLRPIDLRTLAGEEFLIASNHRGETVEIRLDYIIGSRRM
jgi:Rho-binding antiterminator